MLWFIGNYIYSNKLMLKKQGSGKERKKKTKKEKEKEKMTTNFVWNYAKLHSN